MVLNLTHHCAVQFPQDVDLGHLKAVDVVLELEDLMGKLDFLRAGYDEVAQRVPPRRSRRNRASDSSRSLS